MIRSFFPLIATWFRFGALAVFFALCGFTTASAADAEPSPNPVSTKIPASPVGIPSVLDSLLLPGTELVPKRNPSGRAPVTVRITATFPHGTAGFRYNLEWTAFEPGKHNLADYLERENGAPVDDLPPIPVEASGVLPAGAPGMLPETNSTLPSLGGYQSILIASCVVWTLGFIALLLWRRKKAPPPNSLTEPTLTVAERLRPLLEQARSGSLSAADRARLDRLIFGFWRDRLSLGELSAAEAMRSIRTHPEAGAVFRRVEDWVHSAKPKEEGSTIADLLVPYLADNAGETAALPPPSEEPA